MQPQESNNDALALLTAQLQPQERAFVEHFVSSEQPSIAESVRAAGYAIDPKRATSFGENLLRKAPVQRLIALIHAERRERHRDIRDGCLQALWQLAAGWDLKDLIGSITTVNEDGEEVLERGMLAPDQLPAALRAAVKEVSFSKGRWSYKLVDKASILMLLLKHFGELDRLQSPPPPLDATPAKPKTAIWTEESE